MLLTKRIEEAKAFVANSLIFTSAKPTATQKIPLSDTVVSWLVHKNVHQIWATRLASEFFVSMYLRDVVAKRASGIDGYDPASGTQIRLFTDSTTTTWFRSLVTLIEARTAFLDEFLYTYLCAATAGELRHAAHKASGDHAAKLDRWRITSGGKAFNRAETQKRFLTGLTRAESREYLGTATEVFGKHSWGGGYGGSAWAAIADTGLQRAEGKLDPVSFIDRVFDLKHNNGPMFDKNSIVNQTSIQHFLNAKFSATTDADWREWFRWTTKPLYGLVLLAQGLGLWNDKKVLAPASSLNLLAEFGPAQKGPVASNSNDDEDEPTPEKSDEEDDTPTPKNKFTYADKRLPCPNGVSHG